MTTDKHKALIKLLKSGVPIKGEITINLGTSPSNNALVDDLLAKTKKAAVDLKELKEKYEQLYGIKELLRGERDGLFVRREELEAERDELLEAATKPKAKRKSTYNRQLSHEQIWEIRDMIKNKQGDSDIARALDIKASAVWRIRHAKAYKNVPARPHPSVQPHKTVTAHAGHGVVERGHAD
jgi:hypothetical protein